MGELRDNHLMLLDGSVRLMSVHAEQKQQFDASSTTELLVACILVWPRGS